MQARATIRTFLILWTLLILLAGTFPFTNFVGHSHWDYIKWLPTADDFRSPKLVFDIVANIALFLPWGYLFIHSLSIRSQSWRFTLLVTIGCMFSMGIELFQVFCHNRHTSIADVMSNTLGTLIGGCVSMNWTLFRWVSKLTPTPSGHTRVP